jgi:hypothetical protein
MQPDQVYAALGNAVGAIQRRANQLTESSAIRCGMWVIDAAKQAQIALNAIRAADRAVAMLEEATDNHRANT